MEKRILRKHVQPRHHSRSKATFLKRLCLKWWQWKETGTTLWRGSKQGYTFDLAQWRPPGADQIVGGRRHPGLRRPGGLLTWGYVCLALRAGNP